MTVHGKLSHLTNEEFVSAMRMRAGASPVISEVLTRFEQNLDSTAKTAEEFKELTEVVRGTDQIDGVGPLMAEAAEILGTKPLSDSEADAMGTAALLKRLLEMVPQLVEAVRTKKGECPVCEAKFG